LREKLLNNKDDDEGEKKPNIEKKEMHFSRRMKANRTERKRM
jgi:hypothetical protein